MKYFLTFTILFLSRICFSQTDSLNTSKTDSNKVKVGGYLSLGLSVSSKGNFLETAYTSLEGGITYGDFGTGFIFGRGSLKGMGSNEDNIKNYFYEIKQFYTRQIGVLSGTILLGFGGYCGTKHFFAEYGIGAAYTYKETSFGLTYSNWDNVNYLTPSITYNF